MLAGEMGNDTMSYDGWGLFTELLLTGRWLRLFAEINVFGLSMAKTGPPTVDCAIYSRTSFS